VPKLHPDWRHARRGHGRLGTCPRLTIWTSSTSSTPPRILFGDTVKAGVDQRTARWTPTNRDRWMGIGGRSTNGPAARPLGRFPHGGIRPFESENKGERKNEITEGRRSRARCQQTHSGERHAIGVFMRLDGGEVVARTSGVSVAQRVAEVDGATKHTGCNAAV